MIYDTCSWAFQVSQDISVGNCFLSSLYKDNLLDLSQLGGTKPLAPQIGGKIYLPKYKVRITLV